MICVPLEYLLQQIAGQWRKSFAKLPHINFLSDFRKGHLSRIIHRFWATYRKVLDKNRLDLMASRLRIRQSNRKREIETRSHLSR